MCRTYSIIIWSYSVCCLTWSKVLLNNCFKIADVKKRHENHLQNQIKSSPLMPNSSHPPHLAPSHCFSFPLVDFSLNVLKRCRKKGWGKHWLKALFRYFKHNNVKYVDGLLASVCMLKCHNQSVFPRLSETSSSQLKCHSCTIKTQNPVEFILNLSLNLSDQSAPVISPVS